MINEAKRIVSRPLYHEPFEDRQRVAPVAVPTRIGERFNADAAILRPVDGPLRYLDAIRPREPSRITVQIATTPSLMETVYRLRHDSYVAQGFLEPKVSGLFADDWDRMPHFFSMLGFVDGEPAASVRISHCQPAGPKGERTETTAMELFSKEIESLAERFAVGNRPAIVMEMSRLTRHPDFAESNQDPMFGIFRANFYCLIETRADMLISAVRRHHMPFYKTALMACFRHSYEAIQNSIPIFQGIEETDSVYARLFAGERVRIFDEMPARVMVR